MSKFYTINDISANLIIENIKKKLLGKFLIIKTRNL